jgi:hypothetical protein
MDMSYLNIILPLILYSITCSAQFGELRGSVRSDSSNLAIPSALIKLVKKDSVLLVVNTDSLGHYKVVNLKPDTLELLCSAPFYWNDVKRGVLITGGKISFVNFHLKQIKD